MKTHTVFDTLFVCLGLTVMVKVCMVLASYSDAVQLVTALPREFLYVTAFPFVF